MAGVLSGLTIVELAGIGPGPFAGMMLADHGARVIRIERPAASGDGQRAANRDVLCRNREWLTLDLKKPAAIEELKALLRSADAMIEGFRPGVIERLGLAPETLLAINPKLVIGRMTGWGQEGPMGPLAGHDINYIALSGALHTFGRQGEKPSFPVNLVGDFGGGGMMLAFGILAAVINARETGVGQVVDCAMVDGAALLSAATYGLYGTGQWRDERGVNLLDGGAHFYNTFETSDGKWISIGSIEPQFYALLLNALGVRDDLAFTGQMDSANWPELTEAVGSIIRTRTRDEWCEIMGGTDICFAPVLSLDEAPKHPHNQVRGTFVSGDGIMQPAPAPRFSATPSPAISMNGIEAREEVSAS